MDVSEVQPFSYFPYFGKHVNDVTLSNSYVTLMPIFNHTFVNIHIYLKVKKNSLMELSKPIMVNWNEHKYKLRLKFPELKEKDLDFKEGKINDMLGKLQIKLGKTRKELYKIFSTL